MGEIAVAGDAEILIERRGAAGVVTLNRPKALNALTLTMVRGLAAALDAWEQDETIACVVVRGAGEKAFCAGGDIRQLHDLGRAGKIEEARTFWREEYILNARIKTYPKPYVALIDGIVMGGGVGVSVHGSHRIAGPRYLFAMPEVAIGFFPDVGATYALPRLPGASGAYLAVTGERIGQGDALALGLATHALASEAFPALEAALEAGEPVDAALARLAMSPAPESPLAPHRPMIDACFSAPTAEEIVSRLAERAAQEPFAAKILDGMAKKSPTSIKIALMQMHAGATLSFAEAMRLEYRIVTRIAAGHDFYEGVRAVIIDKDHAPRWQPPTLAEVTDAAIAAYAAPLADELPLSDQPAP